MNMRIKCISIVRELRALSLSGSRRLSTIIEVESFLKSVGEKELVLRGYLPAFSSSKEPYLSYFGTDCSKVNSDAVQRLDYSRSDFFKCVLQATNLLVSHGAIAGDRHVHYFSGNRVEDLVFRTASILCSTVPVTVNWQSDPLDKILFKIRVTNAKYVIVDSQTPLNNIEV